MNALVLDNVTKSYGDVRAVDGLSVQVRAGNIYGFLGPNGAGKTTTIRMIMNIILPDSGRMEILGQKSFADAKDRVGYLPEERGLYRRMKVAAILAYFASLKGVTRRELARRIPQWLDEVGLTQWADRRVDELSKGMQQKLQFVVAVISSPDLVILDEPFAGLDPINLDALRSLMLEMRDNGATIILSTHLMEQAEELCDFVLLIDEGRAIVDGTLDEIRSRCASNVVRVQLDGNTDFVQRLPMVGAVALRNNWTEIILKDGADTQELLRALLDRSRLKAFQLKTPSLREAFVHLVGGGDA